MRNRQFGRLPFSVSEIGFGAWGIGGRTVGDTSYGDADDATSNRALDHAVQLGVNFFDTAAAYGDGHSEALIGGLRKRTATPLIVSTKAGIPKFGEAPDFSVSALQTSLTGSLERLGRTRPVGLLLHNPSPAAIDSHPEIIGFLTAQAARGEIAFWGFSVKSPADGIAILNQHDVPILQVNLNMLDVRAVSSGLLDVAAQRQTAIVARTPLCFGFLSGRVDENSTFPPGDHRNSWSAAQKRAWAEGARRACALAGPRAGETMSQTALRFCLSFPAVSVVLPGPMTAEEVAENAAASELGPLSADTIEAVLDLNRRTDFFVRG